MQNLELFPTYHELEPDLEFLTVPHAKFRWRLTEVTGTYGEKPLEMPEVQTLLVYGFDAQDHPLPLQLLLAARFSPASLERLKADFEGLRQSPVEGFCFQIKTEVLARYGLSWCYTTDLKDWLEIGQSAFLDLKNYDLVGYFDFQHTP